MKPLLSINNLNVSFVNDGVETPALHNINFTVNKNELVAIVGESGSGKSVTSLSILKLISAPPANYSNGTIMFCENGIDEIDILKQNGNTLKEIRGKKISMIFQEPMSSLNPVYSCGNQVMEAILKHEKITKKIAKKRTIDLFNEVKLPEPEKCFYKYPHQLSGGQKQRVMIAMAMSCNPTLLICDEPTTALDVTVQKTILELIKELQIKNNMGVLFITHDLNVVSEIADKVIVMYKGKIAEQKPANQLFTNPEHAYTKALLACRPSGNKTNFNLPVVSNFLDVNNDGEIVEKAFVATESTRKTTTFGAENILEVKNLNVWFAIKKNFLGKPIAYYKAVNNVSFHVQKGETLGLVGESGCGKTTLSRSILRLIEPNSGEINFEGANILSYNKNDMDILRRRMQIIFQDPYGSLNPLIKIGEAIAEPLLYHKICNNKKIAKEIVISLLEKVSLNPDYYNRYPHEFSGGQRQRIVIARALALKPSFIICDESVSALDVSVQAQVLNLLNDLKAEFNFSAIFISHDLNVVRYVSDRIMVMNKGIIEEIGQADTIYNSPTSKYTQKLIESMPRPIK